jgi:hypothetical protein
VDGLGRRGVLDMENSMVVFSERHLFEIEGVGQNLLRIPEVACKIREAQTVLDSIGLTDTDLLNMISCDDYLKNADDEFKFLLSTIVQIGLFERYKKSQRRPNYLVGRAHLNSALFVCTGLRTLREVVESSSKKNQTSIDQLEIQTSVVQPEIETVIQPINQPAEYQAFRLFHDSPAAKFLATSGTIKSLSEFISNMVQVESVTQIVGIGPTSDIRSADINNYGFTEVEIMDSIDLDPMLGWFPHRESRTRRFYSHATSNSGGRL